jgi:hypothetical protein
MLGLSRLASSHPAAGRRALGFWFWRIKYPIEKKPAAFSATFDWNSIFEVLFYHFH